MQICEQSFRCLSGEEFKSTLRITYTLHTKKSNTEVKPPHQQIPKYVPLSYTRIAKKKKLEIGSWN